MHSLKAFEHLFALGQFSLTHTVDSLSSWGNHLVFCLLDGLWKAFLWWYSTFRIAVINLVCVCMLSRFRHVRLFVIPGTIARQAPLPMGLYQQEYWSGWPCPPLGHLPNPWIKPTSLMFPALAGRFFTTSTTWQAWISCRLHIIELYIFKPPNQ